MKKINYLCIAVTVGFSVTATSADLSVSNAIEAKGVIFSVIDGDTILVNFNRDDFNKFNQYSDSKTKKNINEKYRSVKLRISSINTPESKHSVAAKNTAKGLEASNYLKSWASNQPVYVKCFDIGHYGRFICNASVSGKDIGLEMIKAGYSDYITKWGKNPYLHVQYTKASQEIKVTSKH